MDELTKLRDAYEEALDDVEERRAEYQAAIRRQSMAGRYLADLAMATGLREARLRGLLRQRDPSRAVSWLLTLRINWRRWIAWLALAALPILAGVLLLIVPPSSFSMISAIYIEEGRSRTEADQFIAELQKIAKLEVVDTQTESERPEAFAAFSASSSEKRKYVERIVVRFPHQRGDVNKILSATLDIHPSFPMESAANPGQAFYMRENIAIMMMGWGPLLVSAGFLLQWLWKFLRKRRIESPTVSNLSSA